MTTTIFTFGYYGWGNATPQLVEAVDAVETSRGFGLEPGVGVMGATLHSQQSAIELHPRQIEAKMDSNADAKLKDLLEFVRAERRVCPQPIRWNALWEMLPDRKRCGVGWTPPLPLILAAWWHASDASKQERLEVHIRHAAEHGVLDEVDTFLRTLETNDWKYLDGGT